MKKIFRGFLKKSIFLCLIFVLASIVYAGVRWTVDGEAISTASGVQYEPTITSDGAGGAIITWQDGRTGPDDIYAQRINSAGVVQWTANGVAICTETDNQLKPTIVSDGDGGAIIAWQDHRDANWNIYAQRINSAGVVQWTANGEAICTEAAQDQYFPTIASDGSGGAIITWYGRSLNFDIFAQRINANGVVQWTTDGEAICTAAEHQFEPMIVSDGSGGAIITWYDERDGAGTDIYAQWINSAGAVQWTADGVAICTEASDQYEPMIVSDGAGGAIITWYDYRDADTDIYAQRIDANGAVKWTADGEAVCIADNDQEYPTIISDGAGGAIITWQDYRGTIWNIYAQRINSAGNVQWTTDGEAICTAVDDQEEPNIVSDGAGGAIITWYDSRSAFYDIYAQRINSAGNVQWTDNGVAISTAADSQSYPTIVSDGTGGAIITWNDDRNPDTDIYAQRISNEPPQITNITPDYGGNNGPVDITNLAGSRFFANATVKLTRSGSSDIQATNVVVVAPTKITCRFDLTSKEIGKCNVIITNTDSQSGSLLNGFEIKVGVRAGKVRVQGGEKGYANPSKGEEVKIHFQAKSSGKVTIKIYTLRGQLVWEDSKQTDGENDFITWDCQNSEGSVVSSGVYIIYVEGPGIKTTKKAAILR